MAGLSAADETPNDKLCVEGADDDDGLAHSITVGCSSVLLRSVEVRWDECELVQAQDVLSMITGADVL